MSGLYTLHTRFVILLHKSYTDKTRTPKQRTNHCSWSPSYRSVE